MSVQRPDVASLIRGANTVKALGHHLSPGVSPTRGRASLTALGSRVEAGERRCLRPLT